MNKVLKDVMSNKLQPSDLYLLALRQTLLNDAELLKQAGKTTGGRCLEYANNSKELANRIEEWFRNGS